jgi:NAD-dependent dihydropyrimidine dehydrogenase PreA subunit
MPKKLTVVISQGQSANPIKRKLEEDLVGALLFEAGIEVTLVPHLYDLSPEGTGMLCLQGITGDVVVLSWLYPRAAYWTLDRNGVQGRFGQTLLARESDADDDSDDDEDESPAEDKARVQDQRAASNRTIYCVDLRAANLPQPFVDEVRRIHKEINVATVELLSWLGGSPQPAALDRYLQPGPASIVASPPAPLPSAAETGPVRVVEEAPRRWYPVIDYSRCTNCMECIDFCLFGVYGVDRAETILVEQPDNCRKGCPACSRVCPENAIIFPQHKSPAIAGSPDENAGGLKIDLSKLFGAPDALDVAVLERDVELVAVGRDAVGKAVGIPKRQPARKPTGPKDELDDLIDALDDLSL